MKDPYETLGVATRAILLATATKLQEPKSHVQFRPRHRAPRHTRF